MTNTPNTTQRDPLNTVPADAQLRAPDRVKRRDREISYEWELAGNEDGGVRLAVLSVMHHKRQPGGYFSASVLNQTVKEMGFMTERSFSPLSATRVSVEPVARFSAKRLDEFATTALERLGALYQQGDPQVHGYFREQA
jgi:hypothetical protein